MVTRSIINARVQTPTKTKLKVMINRINKTNISPSRTDF